MEDIEELQDSLCDNTGLEKERADQHEEMTVLVEMIQAFVNENAGWHRTRKSTE